MCCMLILKKSWRGVKLDSEERERKERGGGKRLQQQTCASLSQSFTYSLTFPNAKQQKRNLYFDVEVVTNISQRSLVLSYIHTHAHTHKGDLLYFTSLYPYRDSHTHTHKPVLRAQ